MHFSKSYAQLLLTLPPEFRDNVFEYRKLKKLINQTAFELDSLGLAPLLLQSLHALESPAGDISFVEKHGNETVSDGPYKHTIVYEIAPSHSALESRLRLSSRHPSNVGHTQSTKQPIYHVDLLVPEHSLDHVLRALFHSPVMCEDETDNLMQPEHPLDLIIPLPSDTAFFQLLTSTLSSLSSHLDILHDNFNSTLATLAASISSTACPTSSSAPRSFSAYSFTARNAMSWRPSLPGNNSDLYTWRKIFRIYTELEVFESIRKPSQAEKSIEQVSKKLGLFEKFVQQEKSSLVLPGSKDALDLFLSLNLFILNLGKFQLANSEATRKILKKHARRTTFPIPTRLTERDASASVTLIPYLPYPSTSLPRLLVQAIGEVLLPVIPDIDDYTCIICTSIAFRPIRLRCGHFFCVRCLAKMQKRGMSNCPMCRAPTVLRANPSNVDYGLLNFMADWFPIESRNKLQLNEREVSQEQLQEFGLADVRVCRIM